MANKYLNYDGVAYLWEKIKNALTGKVDKETGKGLSTNDYTTSEKTKLSNIASGAQVNVIEGVQAAGTTLTPTSKIVNIPQMTGASANAAGSVGLVPAPASGNQGKYLRGDGTWQEPENTTYSDATTTTSGLMSSSDKTKLDGIASGATANVGTITGITTSSPLSGSGTSGSVALSHANSGVTAGSKGDTTAQTPSFGGTFKVPSGTVNATGHLTAFAEHTVTIPNAEASTTAAGLMSTTDKSKLDGIASGAEVNQNAFSTVKVGSTSLSADSKTDTLTITAGSNITLTPTANSDSFSIAATDTTYDNMTQSEATTGTATTARSISAKVLNDTIDAKIAAVQTGSAMFKGTVDTGTEISSLSVYAAGWYWLVTTAGTYVGQTCEVGDMIFCISDRGSSYSASDFTVVQNNMDMVAITNAEIDVVCV